MTTRRSFVVAGTAAVLSSCSRKKYAGFDGYAFVANEEGHAVAAVDLATFSLARHIPLAGAPTRVLAHPLRQSVYALEPATGTVYEIDAGALKISRKASLGAPAFGMRFSQDGSALWILTRKLVRIRLDSLQPDVHINLPGAPEDFNVAQTHNRALVTLPDAGGLSIVDLETGRTSAPVRIGASVGAARFLSDGQSIVAANPGDRLITAVRAEDGRIVAHLPLALRPDHLCFNRDGGQLFVTGEGADAVVVVYPYFIPQVAETVLAGSAPASMAATEQYLFITNPEAGHVSILNIARRKVVAVVAVGAEPAYVAITPDDRYALVLNRRSGDMAVIRTAAILPDRRKSAPLFTMIPVGSKPVSAAVKAVV